MNTQQKNRNIILLLFAMTFVPFVIAWLLSANTGWLGEGTNKGELIKPVITTDFSEYQGFDTFSRQNLKELKGRWVLVNNIYSTQCESDCREALYKTKQIRLMMSKDLTRIRRLVLLHAPVEAGTASMWWREDARLLRARPLGSLSQKLQLIHQSQGDSGGLMIMDPLGNLMMKYAGGFDPYDVKRDLTKLLKVSQIG